MDLKTMAGGEPDRALPRPTTMAQTALVFLDNPLARRLAVAWQTCGGDDDLWFDVAGIGQDELRAADKLSAALRANGICRDGGVTDDLAVSYIAAIVAEPLQKRLRGQGQTKPASRSRR